MNPEQKQAIVDALQQTIDRIKNTKEDQKIGLLLSVGIEKPDEGEDMFERARLLVGYNYIIAHNLADAIRTDEDYTDLFHRTMEQL